MASKAFLKDPALLWVSAGFTRKPEECHSSTENHFKKTIPKPTGHVEAFRGIVQLETSTRISQIPS